MTQYINKSTIKAEIERLIKEYRLSNSAEAKYRCEAYNELLEYINSLQEEPVSENLGKVGSLKSLEYYPEKKTTNKTSKGVFDANMPRRKAYLRGFKDGAHAHKELIANKPVSNDLEEAAKKAGQKYFPNENCIWARPNYEAMAAANAFKEGYQWKKENLWKNAQGDDLPEIDREVVVLYQHYPLDVDEYSVGFAHRPPEYWDGKNIGTGVVTRYYPKKYGKGGWSSPDVKWWLDLDLPKPKVEE